MDHSLSTRHFQLLRTLCENMQATAAFAAHRSFPPVSDAHRSFQKWVRKLNPPAYDLIFFLQHYDVFLQMPSFFSIFRPRACTYRSEPDSCRLAYGTTPFGPIECKPLLMDVSCVSVHSTLRIWLVLTHFLFSR